MLGDTEGAIKRWFGMSARENAEALLLVLKRLGKWAVLLSLGVLVLAGLVAGYFKAKEYLENRPFRATDYYGLRLGDTHKSVLYALGQPQQFLGPEVQSSGDGPWRGFREIMDVSKEKKWTFEQSDGWIYNTSSHRVDVKFDRPAGVVASVTCISEGYFRCPSLFGLHDGSSEDAVRNQLGPPQREELAGTVKRMYYPQFNLTLFLQKRQVYLLRLSMNAG